MSSSSSGYSRLSVSNSTARLTKPWNPQRLCPLPGAPSPLLAGYFPCLLLRPQKILFSEAILPFPLSLLSPSAV